MRGFPLLQLTLVVLLFAAAGLPVWALTRPAAAQAATAVLTSAATPSADAPPMSIEATFAPAPLDFQIVCQGQTVVEGRSPTSQSSAPLKLMLPKEGIDLVVKAEWPSEAGPGAARIIVRLPDGTAGADKSFWAAPGKSLAEVITVIPP